MIQKVPKNKKQNCQIFLIFSLIYFFSFFLSYLFDLELIIFELRSGIFVRHAMDFDRLLLQVHDDVHQLECEPADPVSPLRLRQSALQSASSQSVLPSSRSPTSPNSDSSDDETGSHAQMKQIYHSMQRISRQSQSSSTSYCLHTMQKECVFQPNMQQTNICNVLLLGPQHGSVQVCLSTFYFV
jgi:hypothetical protein